MTEFQVILCVHVPCKHIYSLSELRGLMVDGGPVMTPVKKIKSLILHNSQ